MGDTLDEPLQFIECLRTENDGSITTATHLKEDRIDSVFQNIGDLPVSVMCVRGPSSQEKSFLLGYMIRCLEGLEKDEEDWMDSQDMKKASERKEKFISGLIRSDNLTVQEIMGNPVAATGLRSCLETYVEIFNSDETHSPEAMWQAASLMFNNNQVEKAIRNFQDYIKKRVRDGSYLQEEDLDKAHAAGEKQAMELFKKAKKFGTPETILEFEEKLEDKIKAEFSNFKKQNEEKRRKFITAATTDASDDFRTQLNEEFPFDGESDYKFYDKNNIKRFSEQVKIVVIQEFKEKLSNETEEYLDSIVQSVEEIFETILNHLTNKNKSNRANAGTQMNSIVEELSSSHRSQLQEYFASNEYEKDDTTLQNHNKKIMSDILDLYDQRSKSGKKDFHKKYLMKLETELEDIFSNLKHQHKLRIQDVMIKKEAEKFMKGFYEECKTDLREAALENDMDEGRLRDIYLEKESSILKKFQQVNPFPSGSPQSNKIEVRLKEQLQQIFEQAKVEVVQREMESYQKAIEQALRYYSREMKDIVDSDELIADEDLEAEHERISKEAMNEYENFDKIGVPDKALEMKYDLEHSFIVDEWKRIRHDCDTRGDLLKSKAENCLKDCEKEYIRLMEIEADKYQVGTPVELINDHEKARAAALVALSGSCPIRDPDIIKEYEGRLCEIINERFEKLQEVYDMKRTEEATATKILLRAARQSYQDEMGKHCKNDLFMSSTQLKNAHAQVKEVVMKICEKKSPLSNSQRTDLERCLESLLEIYKKKNDVNLNSGNMEVDNSQTERENERRRPSRLREKAGTSRMCEGRGVSISTSGDGKLQDLPPLVFQLQHTRIRMGMLINDKPQLLKNSSGEDSTPFVVGLTNEGNLHYGNEVLADVLGKQSYGLTLQSNYKKHWLVAEHFIAPGGKPWTESIQLNDIDGTRPKISVEFLLAFILKKLKEQVEAGMEGICSIAVITVPFWFCSTQRIQVKDGARLAGFSEVYLTNEAAAVAYACASGEIRPSSANYIFVISENSELIDASIYEYSSFAKTVKLVGHCGNYCIEESNKDFFKIVTGLHTKLAFRLWNGTDGERVNEDKNLQTIRKLCKEAKRQSQDSKYASVSEMSRPMEVFVTSESEQWRPLLEHIGREFARMVCDINEENGVIVGAALLSRNPKDIRKNVMDGLAFEVLRKCDIESCMRVIPKSEMLPIQDRKFTTIFPLNKEGEIFQLVHDSNSSVGWLKMNRNLPGSQLIEACLTISNEAIAKLADVMITSQIGSSNEYALKSDYDWITPNLTQEDMARLHSLLESLGASELANAKQILLNKCQEMKEQLKSGTVFKIKSELVKEMFAKKIEEAVNFAHHANSTQIHIEGQMESLVRWSSKYIK